jgi:hypothetical protein
MPLAIVGLRSDVVSDGVERGALRRVRIRRHRRHPRAPVDVVKALITGLPVPANAEIVIEGYAAWQR